MILEEFLARLKTRKGKGYYVGGFVRDLKYNEIYKTNIPYKDKDVVITGLDVETFESLFPEAKKIGTVAKVIKSGKVVEERTPVYKLKIDGESFDVALARMELKIAEGDTGFCFTYDKNTTIEKDLIRRDCPMNAIAIEMETGKIIDPLNGIRDLRKKRIRGIFVREKDNYKVKIKNGEVVFLNNEFYARKRGLLFSSKLPQAPLRALRVARFAAQFDFNVEEQTIQALSFLKNEMHKLPQSMIFEETRKAMKGKNPGKYIQVLEKAELLQFILPEIDKLKYMEQNPEFHPEGNTLKHTELVALVTGVLTNELYPNENKRRERNVFGAIFHDVGKGVTQSFNEKKKTFQYLEHEEKGRELTKEVVNKWNMQSYAGQLDTIIAFHMRLHNDLKNVSAKKIIELFDEKQIRKNVSNDTICKLKQYFLTMDELNEIKTPDELECLIKNKIETQKDLGPSIKKQVLLKHKDELLQKQISKIEYEKAKLENRVSEYIKEKVFDTKQLKRWTYIEKEKGIAKRMDIEDFYIVCAADELGRISNANRVEEIITDVAKLMQENWINRSVELQEQTQVWKEKYQLDEKYVNDFRAFLENQSLVKSYFQHIDEFVSTINKETLKEAGKMPDEIALAEFESKQNKAIRFVTGLQKLLKNEQEKSITK